MKFQLDIYLVVSITTLIICAAIMLLILGLRAEGKTVKIRSACDVERLDRLKPGYYSEVR
jgi:hypothetical protein